MCYTLPKIEGGIGALRECDDTNFVKPNGQSRNLNIYDWVKLLAKYAPGNCSIRWLYLILTKNCKLFCCVDVDYCMSMSLFHMVTALNANAFWCFCEIFDYT